MGMTNDDIRYDDEYEDDDRSICPDSDHLWRKASHMWTVCVIKMILKVMENIWQIDKGDLIVTAIIAIIIIIIDGHN